MKPITNRPSITRQILSATHHQLHGQ